MPNLQREMTLRDQRARIVNKAKRTLWAEFTSPRTGINPRIITFKVRISLNHNDQEIEENAFKYFIEGALEEGAIQLTQKTCENICDELYEYIANRYINRDIVITASETGDVGVTISYNTSQPYQHLAI